MINISEFSSKKPGPKLIILGAVHGNETCGARAISKLEGKLKAGKITLERGSVILSAVSNPLAYSKGKRFIDEDLNRIFKKSAKPKSNEQRLANELCRQVDKADILLDLHSTGAEGPPVVFVDFPTRRNIELAKSTGIGLAIVGWPELYRKDGRLATYTTEAYAKSRKMDGILVECGQHESPKAPGVAEKTIMRLLGHLGMIKAKDTNRPKKIKKVIKMTKLFIKEHENDSLARKWKHLQPVKKGAVIATRASGEKIISGTDQIMILPKYNPPVGKEWFYLGKVKK